jgi:hypothetical protein
VKIDANVYGSHKPYTENHRVSRLRENLTSGSEGEGLETGYLAPRQSFTRQTAFQELTEHLNCEIKTLGYPPAALFAFCIALVSYMIIAIMKAALSSVYGADRIDKEVSGYYIADELSAIYPGMMIAVSDDKWDIFRQYNQAQLVDFLKQLAKNVKLSRFKKHPRGPKKPTAKPKSDPKHPHVSTARLLAGRKK